MDYFSAVRIYSAAELTIFTGLVVAAIGHLGEGAVAVLGWTHGVGWILLCIAVAEGCRRRVLPWTAFAATVSPLGPVGSTAALEWLARSRKAGRAEDPAGQPAGG
ncbi:MAG: hypothetical protein ACR2ML_07990 [Solirubrobacteraceae bacterium]